NPRPHSRRSGQKCCRCSHFARPVFRFEGRPLWKSGSAGRREWDSPSQARGSRSRRYSRNDTRLTKAVSPLALQTSALFQIKSQTTSKRTGSQGNDDGFRKRYAAKTAADWAEEPGRGGQISRREQKQRRRKDDGERSAI